MTTIAGLPRQTVPLLIGEPLRKQIYGRRKLVRLLPDVEAAEVFHGRLLRSNSGGFAQLADSGWLSADSFPEFLERPVAVLPWDQREGAQHVLELACGELVQRRYEDVEARLILEIVASGQEAGEARD